MKNKKSELQMKQIRITDIIDIKKLEHESRKFLVLGFIIAVFIHGITGLYFTITWIKAVKETRIKIKRPEPVPIKLIYIPSRRTSPFVLSKKQFQKKSLSRKETEMRKPSRSPNTKSFTVQDEMSFEDSLTYDYETYVFTDPDSTRFVPDGIGLEDDGIQRVEKNHIYLTDEMISVEELDTGQFKGLIVTDPNDMHNIKGYVYIPVGIMGSELRPHITHGAVINLSEFVLKRYTGIEVKPDTTRHINSRDIFKFPFIYITASVPFDLSRPEAENFREYLENGGFALLEPTGFPLDADPCGMSIATTPMRQMIKDTFGHSARLEQIPSGHALFHCYFDIDIRNGFNKYPIKNYDCYWKQPPYCLEGVYIGNRLVLVYSEKGYGYGWKGDGLQSAYKFGINCLLYALRQHGGTTVKLVDVSTNTEQVSRRWWDYNLREKYRNTEKSKFNPVYKFNQKY